MTQDPIDLEHNPAPAVAARHGPIRSTGFGADWGLKLCMAVCLGLLALYGVLWGNAVQVSGGPDAYVRNIDFRAALTAATLVAGGDGPNLYSIGAQQRAESLVLRGYEGQGMLPYTQPPFWALLLVPFLRTGMAVQLVFTVWTLISAAAAGLSLGLLAAGWPARRGPSWLLMLGATSFFPLITALMVGQSTGLALLGLAAATTALKYRRDGMAGGALALVLVQPTVLPALLLALAFARRWRALAGFGLAAAGLAALAMPLLGPGWPLQYVTFALDPSHWVIGRGPSGELPPQTWQALFADLGGRSAAAWGIWAASIATTVLLWYTWARPYPSQAGGIESPAWDRAWALTLLLALPNDPALGSSGLALALVPGWILGAHVANEWGPRRRLRLWTALLLAGYLVTTPVVTLFGVLPAYTPLLWLVIACAVLLWELRRPEVANGEWRVASEEQAVVNSER
jgi:hypothetical protein